MVEVALNEILITPKIPNATLALRSNLFDIESTNTTESRIQSASTATGNEHSVRKLSTESLVLTKVPEGTYELINADATTENKNVNQTTTLIKVVLLPRTV